jgi:hypothetical protein
MAAYNEQMHFFTEKHIFLEIAVPTTFANMLNSTEYYKMKLCQKAYKTKHVDFVWKPTCQTAHPLKLSKRTTRELVVDMFTEFCTAHRNEKLLPHVYP